MPLFERLEAQTVEFECMDDVSCMDLGSWVLWPSQIRKHIYALPYFTCASTPPSLRDARSRHTDNSGECSTEFTTNITCHQRSCNNTTGLLPLKSLSDWLSLASARPSQGHFYPAFHHASYREARSSDSDIWVQGWCCLHGYMHWVRGSYCHLIAAKFLKYSNILHAQDLL